MFCSSMHLCFGILSKNFNDFVLLSEFKLYKLWLCCNLKIILKEEKFLLSTNSLPKTACKL